MVYFQSKEYRIDLSSYKITFIEQSNRFNNDLKKNYSLPLNISFDDIVIEKLGLPDIDNVTSYLSSDKGILYMDDRYFSATLLLGDISKNTIEITIYYGDETLPVYDVDLKDLPWPVIVQQNFSTYAKSMLTKSWPEVTHNWPTVFRKEISGEGDYEHFLGLVNNYNGSNFVVNEIVNEEGQNIAKNYNVMCPFPYLLEILRFGYQNEGKKVRGSVFENEKLKKTLYVPDKFIESFKGSTYDQDSFRTPTSNYQQSSVRYGVYEKSHIPTIEGSYKVDLKINLPPAYTKYFKMEVYQEDAVSEMKTYYYNKSSTSGNRVIISDSVTINVDNSNVGDRIYIKLTLRYFTNSIEEYNSFEYKLSGGQLNTFPISYSLSQFLPELTFGDFVNNLKNWLNLDITIEDEWVNVNFLEESLLNIIPDKHDHLEDPNRIKKSNKNKIYKLIYEDSSSILISNTGQIFSDIDQKNKEVIAIEMPIKSLLVEQNNNIITGAYPEERPDLLLCLYDGLKSGRNPCVENISGSSLSLQDIYEEFWSVWIGIRTNNFTFEDTITAHISEPFSLKTFSYRYNELHMIKEIKRTRISQDYWELDIESETL